MKFIIPKKTNKKYGAINPDGTITYFGDKRYQQYHDKIGFYSNLDHNDKQRREKYRKRVRGIKNKQGKYTYKIPFTANWYSYHYLW